jgi:hypothetical protein
MSGRKHTLTLLGGPSGKVRVSAETLHEAPGALIEGAPSAVRITGWLDTISASSNTILIILPDGHRVQARLEEPDPDLLSSLFGKRVTISGTARFRPSGRLLLVDAGYLGPATPGDVIWERLPAARPGPASPVFTMPQTPRTGVASFFGIWPGEESDEELLRALDEIE